MSLKLSRAIFQNFFIVRDRYSRRAIFSKICYTVFAGIGAARSYAGKRTALCTAPIPRDEMIALVAEASGQAIDRPRGSTNNVIRKCCVRALCRSAHRQASLLCRACEIIRTILRDAISADSVRRAARLQKTSKKFFNCCNIFASSAVFIAEDKNESLKNFSSEPKPHREKQKRKFKKIFRATRNRIAKNNSRNSKRFFERLTALRRTKNESE